VWKQAIGLVCGSRSNTNNKNILNSPVAVLDKNKRNVAGNSETVVRLCSQYMQPMILKHHTWPSPK